MENYFEDLKDVIERGLENDMPRDARLILLGQVYYAFLRDELTYQQYNMLKGKLGDSSEWRRALNFAMSGDDEEYQREEQELARV